MVDEFGGSSIAAIHRVAAVATKNLHPFSPSPPSADGGWIWREFDRSHPPRGRGGYQEFASILSVASHRQMVDGFEPEKRFPSGDGGDDRLVDEAGKLESKGAAAAHLAFDVDLSLHRSH
jgi:hypothetical protein